MPFCIYCGSVKIDSELSLEHIWPAALGGALLPSLFKTKFVCKRCNNLCGLFVDGAFVKSWFVQTEAAINSHEFLDPKKPSAAPLIYLGEERGIAVPSGEICERWRGLAGDRVYHFHELDNDSWHGVAGGDILKRKGRDPGRAYIAFSSANEYWYTSSAMSFKKQFEKATRCVLNGKAASDLDSAISATLFPQPDPENQLQLRDIEALNEVLKQNSVSTTIPIQLGFDSRFLCKIALGIGSSILGEAFKNSAYANELRKGLWSRTPDQRAALKVRGSGFFVPSQAEISDDIKQFMSLRGTWSICLWKHGNYFAAHIHSPRRTHMSIVVEDNCRGYDRNLLKAYDDGVLYFVSPYRNLMAGPLGLDQVLAHKLGKVLEPDLEKIDLPVTKLEEFPPKL